MRRLSQITAACTFVLLIAGATVSATGAGLACPDWPLCHGRLIPPLEPLVLIEWGHRLLASFVGLLLIALAVAVWRDPAARARSGRAAVVLVILLAVQAGLGGVTVLSRLGPAIVATHLATAMLFFVLLVAFAARAQWTGESHSLDPEPAGLRRLAHVALALTYVQVVIGGLVSAFGAGLACPDLPLCRGRLLPPLETAAMLHYAHRLLGLGVFALVLTIAAHGRASRDPVTRASAAAAGVLVTLQVALGALNVLTHLSALVRVAHLAGAGALLAALTTLAVRARVAGEARQDPARPGAPSILGDYVALTKPRIIMLLLVTTITTMVVAAGGLRFGLSLALWTMLGGALAAGAANAINCYWDRDIDAIMRRTRGRPLPAGRVEPRRALIFGVALAVAAVLTLGETVNWLSAALAGFGIVFYVGVYTIWLKRTTPQNIVIGGAAGAIPPLVGWAAITDQVALPSLLLFAIIFLWTPPHFWALALNREDEYRAAGIPMLPVVAGTAETLRRMVAYTLALIACTLALAGVGVLGRLYLVSAVALAVPFLVLVARLRVRTTPGAAWALFQYSIVYLALLFASMAVDRLLSA